MSRLKRTQLVLQTMEGHVVTSTQLEFDGVVNEYITTSSVQWLFCLNDAEMSAFHANFALIMKERHGQQWVNVANLMPYLGWTPS